MIRVHVLNAEGFTLALVDFPSMARATEFARRSLFGTDGRAKLIDRDSGELVIATWEGDRFSCETPAEYRQGGLFWWRDRQESSDSTRGAATLPISTTAPTRGHDALRGVGRIRARP